MHPYEEIIESELHVIPLLYKFINPVALRKAKLAYNFGLSESMLYII